jgi:hypothetical protein
MWRGGCSGRRAEDRGGRGPSAWPSGSPRLGRDRSPVHAGSRLAGDPRSAHSSDTADMLMYGSPRTRRSRRHRMAVRDTQPHLGETHARPPSSGAVSVRLDPEPRSGTEVDDPRAARPAASPVQRHGTTTSRRADLVGGTATVEEQLRRLESRLLAEAGGDPVAEGDVRRHLADSCMRFATAPVRRFLPILVEREVRRRLRAEDRLA